MKIRLFFKILIILIIAGIGLFFVYNNGFFRKDVEIPVDFSQNIQKPVIKQDEAAKGDPKLKKQVKVDLSRQKVFLYKNGELVREFTISSGKPETPTPTGKFRVIHKQDMVYSKPTGCWLSFWVGFTMDGKYGFHETPICEGERVGEDKIGIPDSAGCIRLKLGEAEEFYNWAEIEMPIEIYGQTR